MYFVKRSLTIFVSCDNNIVAGDAYDAEERIVVAGYDNGDVKMFDLKKMAIRWETNVKNGVHDLLLFAKLFTSLYF